MQRGSIFYGLIGRVASLPNLGIGIGESAYSMQGLSNWLVTFGVDNDDFVVAPLEDARGFGEELIP